MFWEHRLVPLLLARRIEERPGPVGFAIVLQLEGVAADEHFRGTNEAVQNLLVILHQSHIHVVRRIARHDQQYRNGILVAARLLNVVSQMLEYQPFIQGTERSGHL